MRRITTIIFSVIALTISTLSHAETTSSSYQPRFAHNGVFNHLDLAFTAGSPGLGFDLSTPVTDWARLRTGATFMPIIHKKATFGMEVAKGLSATINEERFNRLSEMMYSFTGYTAKNHVDMEGDIKFNNFKFMVDIFPFKNNRHWHATIGFYYGNSTIFEAKNSAESMNTLTAISIYNNMYRNALANRSPLNLSTVGIDLDDPDFKLQAVEAYKRELRHWGSYRNDKDGKPLIDETEVTFYYDYLNDNDEWERREGSITIKEGHFAEYGISLPLGTINHDVIAQEDIYYDHDERLYKEIEGQSAADFNTLYPNASIDYNDDKFHYQKDRQTGRYIKKGEIRYKKGEVIHKAGDGISIVPDKDNIVNATAKVAKFKPYVGIGYETSAGKDSRLNIGVNAGVMFWGGHPSIDVKTPIGINAEGETIYLSYDLTRDISGINSGIDKYVKLVKNFAVFPELSLRLAYRIW